MRRRRCGRSCAANRTGLCGYNRRMLRGMLVLLMTLSAFGAERKVITPANGVPPVGPYSPGIFAGDYLYVSGQGAALPAGGFPKTTEEQTAQTLKNVRG